VKEFFMDKEKMSSDNEASKSLREKTNRNSGLSGIMDAYISGEIQKSAEKENIKEKSNSQILSLI